MAWKTFHIIIKLTVATRKKYNFFNIKHHHAKVISQAILATPATRTYPEV